jgi:hypothetical protein
MECCELNLVYVDNMPSYYSASNVSSAFHTAMSWIAHFFGGGKDGDSISVDQASVAVLNGQEDIMSFASSPILVVGSVIFLLVAAWYKKGRRAEIATMRHRRGNLQRNYNTFD